MSLGVKKFLRADNYLRLKDTGPSEVKTSFNLKKKGFMKFKKFCKARKIIMSELLDFILEDFMESREALKTEPSDE